MSNTKKRRSILTCSSLRAWRTVSLRNQGEASRFQGWIILEGRSKTRCEYLLLDKNYFGRGSNFIKVQRRKKKLFKFSSKGIMIKLVQGFTLLIGLQY